MISKYRPKAAIFAFTHIEPVVNRMNLYWGVRPVRCPQARSAEQMVTMAEKDLVRRGLLKPGDVLGVVAGTRQASGSTNLMRLHLVTDEEAEQIAHPKSPRKNPRPEKPHSSSGAKL
jgi:pyruvate kinase